MESGGCRIREVLLSWQLKPSSSGSIPVLCCVYGSTDLLARVALMDMRICRFDPLNLASVKYSFMQSKKWIKQDNIRITWIDRNGFVCIQLSKLIFSPELKEAIPWNLKIEQQFYRNLCSFSNYWTLSLNLLIWWSCEAAFLRVVKYYGSLKMRFNCT